MHKPQRLQVYTQIADKIKFLIVLLHNGKEKYDHAAGSVADRQIRDTIRMLAQEHNQYAGELSSHLLMMGVIVSPSVNTQGLFVSAIATETEEVLKKCCAGEKEVVTAYRAVLNEPFVDADTRRILR